MSYFIRNEAEAAVIDPSVDPEVYLSIARDSGADIRKVLDTHVHADHLSRARPLADKGEAELFLPFQDRVRYPHKPVTEGDKLSLGAISISVLSTPGHTDESVSYLVPEVGVFTGNTLFLAGVGRPDLHADGYEREVRSRLLFKSLLRLTSLDPQLMAFPGHTSEPVPFDEEMLTASVGEVARRVGDWLSSEDEFVKRVLARIPSTPPNYLAVSGINERGEWPESDPTDLEAGANRCAVS